MNAMECGLLALFMGEEVASRLIGVDISTARDYRKLISFSNCECLGRLGKILKDACKQVGPDSVNKELKVPIKVLECLLKENNEGVVREMSLKERVVEMYRKTHVSIRAIQKLFDLPNTNVISSWGDYYRKSHRETLIRMRDQITQLTEQGESLEDIRKILGISMKKVRDLMVECKRTTVVYSTNEIKASVRRYLHEKISKKKISNELGISTSAFTQWNDRVYHEHITWYSTDDEGTSNEKVKAVETYLLTNNIQLASQETNKPLEAVQKWVYQVLPPPKEEKILKEEETIVIDD